MGACLEHRHWRVRSRRGAAGARAGHDLVAEAPARAAGWRAATIAFAIGQAAAAYGYAYLFDRAGSYLPLFALAALALLLALLIDLFAARRGARMPAIGRAD